MMSKLGQEQVETEGAKSFLILKKSAYNEKHEREYTT